MGVVEMEAILGIDPINHRSVLELDHSNNVDDGNKLNKLKFDQSDLESDQSNLESDPTPSSSPIDPTQSLIDPTSVMLVYFQRLHCSSDPIPTHSCG